MIVVAACTYQRPDFLTRLLDSFATLDVPAETAFVIVDNDGRDPAVRALVDGFAARTGRRASFIVEPEPGISAARNACFAEACRLGATTVAMLDDDEWPPREWLRELIAERDRTGAKVVGGPVRPVFSEARAHLRRHARFWSVEADTLDGKPFVFCTCNFLIELDAIAFLGDAPFDAEFGVTGGGDTVFFRKLARAGVPMAWAERAILQEEIPDARAGLKWLRQRRYRAGNVTYRWERDTPMPGQLDPRLKTLAAIARLPIYPLISREKSSRWLAWLLEYDKVRGRIAAQFGSLYAEYAREPAGAARKSCR